VLHHAEFDFKFTTAGKLDDFFYNECIDWEIMSRFKEFAFTLGPGAEGQQLANKSLMEGTWLV